MKNFNDTIGNRTRDLPACSAVPQLTASLRASSIVGLTQQLPAYLRKKTYVNSSLRKFLPTGANLKRKRKLWKRILHPVGNKYIILYSLIY
jgi:hypothetical protein